MHVSENGQILSCHVCVQVFGFKGNAALSLEKQLQ